MMMKMMLTSVTAGNIGPLYAHLSTLPPPQFSAHPIAERLRSTMSACPIVLELSASSFPDVCCV